MCHPNSGGVGKMEMAYKNFLLTGEPGVGKTTIIKAILSEINLMAGGFYTEEIRSGKTRKGFQLMTLDGKQAVMASISKKSTYKVGKYGVDLDVLKELAVPSLNIALADRDIIVIDEIGKMECFSKEFRDMVERCLNSDKPVIGTIQNFASPFINSVTNRDDVVIITTTETNRNELANNIVEILKQFQAPDRTRKKSPQKRK